jgi:hypothetical protein
MNSAFKEILLLALAAGSIPSLAQESGFGLQAHLAMPLGKIADSEHLDQKNGLGVGIYFPVYVPCECGWVLRPKLDYLRSNRQSQGITARISTLSVIVDVNFYLSGSPFWGPYLIAGVGLNSSKRELGGSLYGLPSTTAGSSDFSLAYNVGLGYQFSRAFQGEVKYFGADLKDFTYMGRVVEAGYLGKSVVLSIGRTF